MEEEKPQYITPDIEKRQHRRVRLVTEVRCAALGRQEVLVTRDVSIGGLFVSAKKPFPSDAEVSITMRLRPEDKAISCRGKVAYSLEGMGMGVQFTDLSEEDLRAIQKFVDAAI